MLLEKWFSTPIWSDSVEFDYESVARQCLELQKTYPNRVLSNEGGWQSQDINLDEFENLRVVKQIINQKIDEFSTEASQQKIILDNVWVNINYPGCKNKQHIHPVAAFSGTIYVSVPENSGRIVFTDDFTPSKHYPINIDGSPIFHKFVNYTPKNGTIIFFPAWVAHRVELNRSNKVRISISFNIKELNQKRD